MKKVLLLSKTVFVLLAMFFLQSYLNYTSNKEILPATAARDNSEQRQVQVVQTQIGSDFARLQDEASLTAFSGLWPAFRGPQRDNIVTDSVPLQKTWGADGPKVLWRTGLGEGYAGAIIVNARAYVLDYLEAENADALRCFALLSGEELWRRYYHNPIRRNHGKSRTVPACANNVVVSFGPAAHVMAVEATSGELLWTRDLVRDYGAEVPQWYAGQCPLIDRDRVVLGIGGTEVLLTALDLRSGETLWELPNQHAIKMSHSSVLLAEFHGVKQYIYAGIGGISACDDSGQLLWQNQDWKPPVWAPTPVQLDQQRLFLTAGYGAGSAILHLNFREGKFSTVLGESWKPNRGPASEQQTPLLLDGALITIQPKDAGARRCELVASAISALPDIAAGSGRDHRFGLGPYLYADGALWIMDDDGVLHVYSFADWSFTELARCKVLPGVDSWGPIALANGIMLLRDSTSMVCLDLRKEP